MRWNNEVVKFSETISKLLDDYGKKGALKLIDNARELSYIKPSTREYISTFKKGLPLEFGENLTRDMVIKKAIREALPKSLVPSGLAFASLVSTIKEKGVSILKEATSDRDFDNRHSDLCAELLAILGDSYDYIDASRIIDYFHLYLLLLNYKKQLLNQSQGIFV